MYLFWNTIKKIGRSDAYDFKLDKKKCRVNTEVFREILQFCPRIPNQDFVELPLEEYLLTLIKEFGYSGRCVAYICVKDLEPKFGLDRWQEMVRSLEQGVTRWVTKDGGGGGEDQQNASHESGFVQEEEKDAHVTLTIVHEKTEGPLQSSSISSDFTSKLLNLDDPSTDINLLMNSSTIHPPTPLVNPSSHPIIVSQ
uniref:Uncharacterized protein n=1 Tax=Tanacetum cinerariifolium TaxID=118510 RepID=A0A6L2LMN2_TANCI|nr:hypothetical protein [Tanacetum cinerariifolium]